MSTMTMYQACLMHSRAERVLKTIVAKHLKNFGITRMEWIVLASLESNTKVGGYTMSELSQVLDIKLSQLTILSGGIISSGLAKQVTSHSDKRTKLVTITPKGKKLVEQIDASMRQALREWLSHISRAQLINYMQTLKLLGEVA